LCCACEQVHELTNALTLARSDLGSAEAEVSRLKELHSQVKAALQESYSTQQEQQKQVRTLGAAAMRLSSEHRVVDGVKLPRPSNGTPDDVPRAACTISNPRKQSCRAACFPHPPVFSRQPAPAGEGA
jgi:hypothetical protein